MLVKLCFVLLSMITLNACSTMNALPCSKNFSNDAQIILLAKKACTGDKYASFKLATYFENGTGVQQNLDQAIKYYKYAATYHSGLTYIYVPGAGQVPGHTLPVTTGVNSAGLPEAQYRLAKLYFDNNSSIFDEEKAKYYLELSARAGYHEAIEFLSLQN